jgi:hypothetical protein
MTKTENPNNKFRFPNDFVNAKEREMDYSKAM